MLSTRNLKIFSLNYRCFKTKWVCISCARAKTSVEPKKKTYSHTVLTPKTNFPARSTDVQKEQIPQTAKFPELYEWQREHLKGPEFVLHDGPPYANGDLHMGHAVNKIIKDINNRNQVLQGNKVHYVPGWDCHGLPIELKALQKAKKTSKDNEPTDPIQIRNIARKFALETVEKQKDMFRSWGVMADWDKQCYLTLNNDYVQKQLWKFYEMYKKGLIYRALKPVYWSPSSKTALAEAELEYDPHHKSKEVYVSFPMETMPPVVANALNSKNLSAMIWTTTPWTLVANRAICYNPSLRYSVVSLARRPGYFLVATELVQEVGKTLGVQVEKVMDFDGGDLSGTYYRHPLSGAQYPLLRGPHVSAAKGTGLVHTAPPHGPDDFLVAIRNNMSVECNVDEAGRYTNVSPELDGLYVLKEGQDAVTHLLADHILHQGTYTHSYPLDWRTKQPVIIRASQQWFIDTAALKDKALRALDLVSILPPSSAGQSLVSFRSQLERRPYWCISRQRAWGVPLPVLYQQEQAIVHRDIIKRLCELMETRGADAWWTCDVTDLITDDVIAQYKLDLNDVSKGKDIMDIWLDSGVSWQTLDSEGGSAVCCEGVDQLTGWFQTSLLTAVALTGDPPYRSLFVHGFVVDEKRRKMSKSIGNVVDPDTIIKGGKDKKKDPAYGVDTLRWWVASHATQHSQIIISKKLLDDCQAEVIRIRNILKFLLAVINDVDKADFERKPNLNFFDKYLVKECDEFLKQIVDAYNEFRYNNVAQNILFFISNKVSGLYCHCVKDRLYCSHKDSENRLAAKLVIHKILVTLSKALGPILPHLVEEAWQHHPLHDKPFFFTENIPNLTETNVDTELMDRILSIKKEICSKAQSDNIKKYTATILLEKDLFDKLTPLNIQNGVDDSVLSEILEVSNVSLEMKSAGLWEVYLSMSKRGQCARCRKFNAVEESDKCVRCDQVVAALSI